MALSLLVFTLYSHVDSYDMHHCIDDGTSAAGNVNPLIHLVAPACKLNINT